MAGTVLSRKAQRALKKARKADGTKENGPRQAQEETITESQSRCSSSNNNPPSSAIHKSPLRPAQAKVASPVLSPASMDEAQPVGVRDLPCVQRHAMEEPLWDGDEDFNPCCLPLPSYKQRQEPFDHSSGSKAILSPPSILSPLTIPSQSSLFRIDYHQESSSLCYSNEICRPAHLSTHFQILELRGVGSFGIVVSARQQYDGRVVCIKICDLKGHQKDEYAVCIGNEIEVRRRLRAGSFNPFVLETVAHWTENDLSFLVMVMSLNCSLYIFVALKLEFRQPFMCGDLRDLLDHRITVPQLQTYMLQIVRPLLFPVLTPCLCLLSITFDSSLVSHTSTTAASYIATSNPPTSFSYPATPSRPPTSHTTSP